jgi:hypothetical protein
MSFPGIQVELEIILIGEICQSHNNKYHLFVEAKGNQTKTNTKTKAVNVKDELLARWKGKG